jgi:hypothetical protein
MDMILLVASFVCFVLAAVGVGGRINLIGAGLACYVAVQLF